MPISSTARAAQYPTFPKPWIAIRAPSMGMPFARRASRVAIPTPSPVAEVRPSEPPRTIGLPVTTPGTEKPALTEYVSIIHAMFRSSVPTSGAGISRSGPMIGKISEVYLRVNRSFSRCDKVAGSTLIPPLAPPYGRLVSAHFQVINIASATVSSRSISG